VWHHDAVIWKSTIIFAILWMIALPRSTGPSRNDSAGRVILCPEVSSLLRDPVKVSRQNIAEGMVLIATAKKKSVVENLIQATQIYRGKVPIRCRPPEGIDIVLTILNNGIRLKITGSNEELIKEIHDMDLANESEAASKSEQRNGRGKS
jgi:hypothetical protein